MACVCVQVSRKCLMRWKVMPVWRHAKRGKRLESYIYTDRRRTYIITKSCSMTETIKGCRCSLSVYGICFWLFSSNYLSRTRRRRRRSHLSGIIAIAVISYGLCCDVMAHTPFCKHVLCTRRINVCGTVRECRESTHKHTATHINVSGR